MRVLLRVGLLCMLCVCSALAGEIAPFREGNRLGAHVRNVQFPPTLRKDLRSGLTTRVLVRMELLAESRVIDTKTLEVAVKYDLWDETFRLTMQSGQGDVTDRVLQGEEQVLALLADVRFPALFDTTRLQGAREHELKGEVLVNPIEKERMAMIRKWVAENSTQTPRTAGPPAPVSATASGGDLFNRIFDQYSAGTSVAAAFHEKLRSPSFRPEAVAVEGSREGQ